MEAGTIAEHGRTAEERFQDLIGFARRLPMAVKAAAGLVPLFAVVIWAAGSPETGRDWVFIALVYAGGVAALARFGDRPAVMGSLVLAQIVLLLLIYFDLRAVAQASLNGLSLGAILALGAVGLTLVYGTLKLVNFAHGDFLTFGAYIAFVVNVTLGLPFSVAVLGSAAATALLGVMLERGMWGPMRARGAGMLQLLVMAIGLALVIRHVIQFIWGTEIRTLDVNRTDTVSFLDLQIGRTDLIVVVIGFAVLIGIGLMLRFTLQGKRMRALSDNLDLAETAGIDTSRVILLTWVFAGALAGLAGAMVGATQVVVPEVGFMLLLPIFAAVILGGIGDAFGALAAGVLLGLVIEWSTLVIEPRWKIALGFVVLILVLMIRPQGIFGRARAI